MKHLRTQPSYPLTIMHTDCARPNKDEQRHQTCCLCLMTKQMCFPLCHKTIGTLRGCKQRVKRSLLQHKMTYPSPERVESSSMSLAPDCVTRGPCLTNMPRCLSKSLCPIRFSADRSLSMYIYHSAAKHQSIADTVTLDVP